MEIEKDYSYLKTHEWVRVEGDLAYVGLSAPACEMLGEIIYVEFPERDGKVKAGQEICTVEAVKTASAIYAPVSGTIADINEDLEDSPELIEEDPYGRHIFVIRMSDQSELTTLLDARTYKKLIDLDIDNQTS